MDVRGRSVLPYCVWHSPGTCTGLALQGMTAKPGADAAHTAGHPAQCLAGHKHKLCSEHTSRSGRKMFLRASNTCGSAFTALLPLHGREPSDIATLSASTYASSLRTHSCAATHAVSSELSSSASLSRLRAPWPSMV